jgi:dihydrofolate reductase
MNFDGFLSTIATIFYGRVSYDIWGNYQPGKDADQSELRLWQSVHSKKKFVFSSQNRHDDKATFIGSNLEKKVFEIKNKNGRDIWLYGGASLITSFIRLNLIDVYRISVHPIVLGSGKPLFANLKERVHLKLMKTNTFKSGVVQLIYEARR